MPDRVKVAIVGSGPAGLSAAARAAQLGMSHVLLEKTDHLSDTIYKYQKGKHVMATPSNLVLRSDMDFEAGKRETILGIWDEQIDGHKVNVMLNAEVNAITGKKGEFRIALKNGQTVEAEAIILAIGTQGNPNLVRCPVGEGAQVQYQLDDPGEYVDEHITVIGAGDAEGAIDALIEIFRRDREWNEGAAKEQLFKLFDSLGPKSVAAQKGPRRLSSMIFL